VDSLHVLQELLGRSDQVTREEVVERLGNDVSAINSVPTAIYAFLRALQPIQGIEVSGTVIVWCTVKLMFKDSLYLYRNS
jgi:hypothetical protein